MRERERERVTHAKSRDKCILHTRARARVHIYIYEQKKNCTNKKKKKRKKNDKRKKNSLKLHYLLINWAHEKLREREIYSPRINSKFHARYLPRGLITFNGSKFKAPFEEPHLFSFVVCILPTLYFLKLGKKNRKYNQTCAWIIIYQDLLCSLVLKRRFAKITWQLCQSEKNLG